LTLFGLIYQLNEWQNRESALGNETGAALWKQPKLQKKHSWRNQFGKSLLCSIRRQQELPVQLKKRFV
jgi:hypothetical protein